MTQGIEFFVAGMPKAQPRTRAFNRGGFTRMYTPRVAEEWRKAIALEAKPLLPEGPIEGAVLLRLHFIMPRPKADFRRDGSCKRSDQYHIKKPDLDNLAKAVMDEMTGLGFWGDDRQVASLHVSKINARRQGEAGVMIFVKSMSGDMEEMKEETGKE
tara:strand:+ start:2716 stop:3186 length:471 start_codon:yes stop_codon:yes gene_type:complete